MLAYVSVLSLVIYLSVNVYADCQISTAFTDKSPFILSADRKTIIYPDHGKKNISIRPGQNLNFGCSNGQFWHLTNHGPIVQATCLSNGNFKINGAIHSWNNLVCSGPQIPVRRYTGKSCNVGKAIEIGFSFGNSTFISQIDICFDSANLNTLYTHYEIISAIKSQPPKMPRPSFEVDPEFSNVGPKKLDKLYKETIQRQTINMALGLPKSHTKYIQHNNTYFLARGHLAANADFFYPAQVSATFRYINVAPQWQTFNGKNWATAEANTRSYADRNKVTLKVWTGTYGVTTLPHETTKIDTKLYLNLQKNQQSIPVPALFWKIVLNPLTEKGVVLIGVNNPYERNVEKYIKCRDVSRNLSWLTWTANNKTSGYSYACSVPEFRRVVSYVPKIQVRGLLL